MRALAGQLGGGDALCGTSPQARETARALGLDATIEPTIDECAFGNPSGRALAQIGDEDPDGVRAWMTAAVVHALGAPPAAFWRVDAAPLAPTELHAHDGRRTLTRANAELAPAAVAAPAA